MYQDDIHSLESRIEKEQAQLTDQFKELKAIKRDDFYALFDGEEDKASELWVLLCLQKQLINESPLSIKKFTDFVKTQIRNKVSQQTKIAISKKTSNKKITKTEIRLRKEVEFLNKLLDKKNLLINTLSTLNEKMYFGVIFSQFVCVWENFERKKQSIYKEANNVQDLLNKKVNDILSKYERKKYNIENEFNNKVAQKRNAIYLAHPDLIITEEDRFGWGAMVKNMQLQQILQEDEEYNQLLQDKNNQQNEIDIEKNNTLKNNQELVVLQRQANMEYQRALKKEEELKAKQQKKIDKLAKIEHIINNVNASVCEVQYLNEQLSKVKEEEKINNQNNYNKQLPTIPAVEGEYKTDANQICKKQAKDIQNANQYVNNLKHGTNTRKSTYSYTTKHSREESYINHIAHIGGYKVDKKIVNNNEKPMWKYSLYKDGEKSMV